MVYFSFKWRHTDPAMQKLQAIPLLLSLLWCIGLNAQQKTIHYLDQSNYPTILQLHVRDLVSHPLDNRHVVIGDFIAIDDSLNSILPYFSYDLGNQNGIINTYEQTVGVTANTRPMAACFDAKGQLYFGGVNGANDGFKFVSKINTNNQILWTTIFGHHSINDLIIIDDMIFTTSQDEDSNARHSFLVSKLDTNGNLLATANFNNNSNNSTGVKLVVDTAQQRIYAFGISIYGAQPKISIKVLDYNLQTINSRLIEHSIGGLFLNDVVHKNGNFYLCGTFVESGKDHGFFIQLDEDINISRSSLFKDTTAANNRIALNALVVDNQNDVHLGVSGRDTNNLEFPIAIKLSPEDTLLWQLNLISTDTGTTESISNMELMKETDSLRFTGEYRVTDGVDYGPPALFELKMHHSINGNKCFQQSNLFKDTVTFLSRNDSNLVPTTFFGDTNSLIFEHDIEFMLREVACLDSTDTIGIRSALNRKLIVQTSIDHIQISSVEPLTNSFIELYSILGVRVASISIEPSKTHYSLSTSQLPSGIYILTLRNSSTQQVTESRKIIISH